MATIKATTGTGDPGYHNLLIAVKRVVDIRLDIKYAEGGLGGDISRLKLDLYEALERLDTAYTAVRGTQNEY